MTFATFAKAGMWPSAATGEALPRKQPQWTDFGTLPPTACTIAYLVPLASKKDGARFTALGIVHDHGTLLKPLTTSLIRWITDRVIDIRRPPPTPIPAIGRLRCKRFGISPWKIHIFIRSADSPHLPPPRIRR